MASHHLEKNVTSNQHAEKEECLPIPTTSIRCQVKQLKPSVSRIRYHEMPITSKVNEARKIQFERGVAWIATATGKTMKSHRILTDHTVAVAIRDVQISMAIYCYSNWSV
jgi:hypothetical protein